MKSWHGGRCLVCGVRSTCWTGVDRVLMIARPMTVCVFMYRRVISMYRAGSTRDVFIEASSSALLTSFMAAVGFVL